jgi:hypothetical protein
MNYGYQQPGGMMQGYAPQQPMMPGSGYGAPMMTNFQNTTADVEAQRKRLKALGLDDTMIDDALSFKQGLFEKRDEMQGKALEAIGGGIKAAGSNITGAASAAGAGLKGLASSL